MYSNWQNPVEQDQSEQGAAHSSVAPFIANGPYNPSDTPNFMETVYFSEAGSTYSLDYGTMFGRSQAASQAASGNSYDRDGAGSSYEPESMPLGDENQFEEALKSQTELEKVQQKLLVDATKHSLLVFAHGGDESNLAVGVDPLQEDFLESVAPAATIQYLKAEVAGQTTALVQKVRLAMSDFIVDHFKHKSSAAFFYPHNLRNTAKQMLKFSFDIHHKIYSTWESTHSSGSAASASDKGKVAEALARISAHARIYTVTEASTQMPIGEQRPIEIAHFDQELLEGILACAICVFLTEYPHLRTVFGPKRRLPRTAYLMPALELFLYWEARQDGYPPNLPGPIPITPAGEIRLISMSEVMEFIKGTDEGRRMAKKIGDLTSLLFVPEGVKPFPSEEYARMAYYSPRHRYKPPGGSSRRTVKKTRTNTAPYIYPRPLGASTSSTSSTSMTAPTDHIPQLVDNMALQWGFDESAENYTPESDVGSESHSQGRA